MNAGSSFASPVELQPVLREKFFELVIVLARFTLRNVPVNSTRKNHLFLRDAIQLNRLLLRWYSFIDNLAPQCGKFKWIRPARNTPNAPLILNHLQQPKRTGFCHAPRESASPSSH